MRVGKRVKNIEQNKVPQSKWMHRIVQAWIVLEKTYKNLLRQKNDAKK